MRATIFGAALLYGDAAFTVQAHPEFSNPFTADMIARRGPGLVPDPLLDAARARLEEPIQDGLLADRIARFFHESVEA